MDRTDIAVVGVARTPFGRFGGSLRDFSLPELGAVAVTAALERSGLEPDDVDEVGMGVNLPGADRSVARQVLIESGIPESKVAYTVDRACCSSLAAITMVSRSLRLDEARIGVAGGTENMSIVPYFLTRQRWGSKLGDVTLKDQLVIADPMTGKPRALQAGEEAVEYGISREEQDAWAVRSHLRVQHAVDEHKFVDEIVPMKISERGGMRTFDSDESIRPDSSMEKLAALPTIYGSPTVTAGNAPGLSSGASALVLMRVGEAEARGLEPLATLHGWSMASGHPDRIASIPAVAARMALEKTGTDLEDVDLIEINEAFAAVPLVSTLLLADEDPELVVDIRNRTNPNGGSIAIGHPTGATAARLVMTAILELRRQRAALAGSRRLVGLVSICGGIGEAEAVIVRV